MSVPMADAAQRPGDHPSGLPATLIREQVERLLADIRFSRSQRLSRFLRYTVEKELNREGETLKEYLIALEVYDKPSSYDPTVDSLVRVEVSRLRSKLRDYYQTEGRSDPIRIDYPKGQYAPIFTSLSQAAEASSPDPVAATPAPADEGLAATVPHQRRHVVLSAILLLIVAIASGWLLRSFRAAHQPVLGATPSIAVLPFATFGS